jgi:hypothetical protein
MYVSGQTNLGAKLVASTRLCINVATIVSGVNVSVCEISEILRYTAHTSTHTNLQQSQTTVLHIRTSQMQFTAN